MESKKTHWKKLTNPDYLGSWDIGETKSEKTFKIIDVKQEMITGQGGSKSECTVMYMEGSKPMILNKTNAKSITKAYDTPYIEEWVGKSITIFVSREKAFGELMDCLRIRSKAVEKKKPTLTDKRFTDSIEAINKGQFTKEKLLAQYDLKPEQIKTLKES